MVCPCIEDGVRSFMKGSARSLRNRWRSMVTITRNLGPVLQKFEVGAGGLPGWHDGGVTNRG